MNMVMMRDLLLPTKANLLKVMVEYANVPYLWGGKGTHVVTPTGAQLAPYFGFDCSGLYTFSVKKVGGPDHRFTDRAMELLNDRPVVERASLQPCDLVLFGSAPKSASHVEMVLTILPDGTVITIGASGGDHTTTTKVEAERRDARVKVRTGHTHGRADFIGFRAGLI
jgi:murein DD-endopeptidase